MTKRQLRKELKKARRVIKKQKRVAVGVFLDSKGDYCAVGALKKYNHMAIHDYASPVVALDQAAIKLFHAQVFDANDKLGRDAVLKIYDEAIANV